MNTMNWVSSKPYNAVSGRWMAKDPIQFDGGQTNLYVYVVNNPINLIDLNGRNPLAAAAVAGGVAGSVGGLLRGLNAGQTGWELAGDVGIGALTGAGAGVGMAIGIAASTGSATAVLLGGQLGASGAFTGYMFGHTIFRGVDEYPPPEEVISATAGGLAAGFGGSIFSQLPNAAGPAFDAALAMCAAPVDLLVDGLISEAASEP